MIYLSFLILLVSTFSNHNPGEIEADSTEAKTIIRTDDLMDWAGMDYISFDRLSFSAYSARYGFMGSSRNL